MITNLNLEQMQLFARELTQSLNVGEWIFLNGDLGAGKTYLTQQILATLGTAEKVTSPTFPLLTCIKTTHLNIKKVCHLDLYRLKHWQEIMYFGLEEELTDSNYIVIVEWANMLTLEQWGQFLSQSNCPKPKRILQIDIQIVDENSRHLQSSLFTLD